MTASGTFWTADKLRHSIAQMENCRDDILKRLRDGSIDDTLREDQQIEADIYRQAIEHEARLLRQLEERGDV